MRHFVRVSITAAVLLVPVQAIAQNGIVDLPQQYIDTTYPAQSGELTVCASGCTHTNLQTAINAAVPGNTIKVAPSWVHTGTITFRPRPTRTISGL